MKRRIPPPLIMLGFGILMYSTVLVIPDLKVENAPVPYVSMVLILIGVALEINAGVSFYRHKTTVNPLDLGKSTDLVVTGVFKFTRNPMYLGMALMLVGLALKLSHPVNALWIWGFVYYITKFQIMPEERALLRLFGAPYLEYKSRVRRWI